MKEKLLKTKMYIQSHIWLQYSLIWIGLLVISALGMNDNYHTLSWINRIFLPYKDASKTFFIGTIILIIAIYNLFRAFYYTTGNYLFNKKWKCFICTVIFVNLLSGINEPTIQKIRGLYSGLDAIYLDRSTMLNINFYDISMGKEKVYRVEGFTTLKNCSDEAIGPFYITIMIPQNEYHPGGSFTCKNIFELAPGEQQTIPLNYEGPFNDFIGKETYEHKVYIASEGIQMTLWNNVHQVTFYSE